MQRLLHRHIQHIIDAFSFVFYLQSLPVIPFSVTYLAGHVHIRQEMHFNFDNAVSAAGLAAAALYIEAEAAFFVSPGFGVSGGGKQIPDHIEHAGIGGRIRPGSAANGGLIDVDYLVQLLQSPNAFMLSGNGPRPVQVSCQAFVKNFIDQGTFPGTGYAGDAGHNPQGKLHIDIFQIVFRRPQHRNPAGRLFSGLRHRNFQPAA